MAILILNFHGVGGPSRAYEPGEESVWLSEADFRSVLDEVADDSAGLELTFDDGNASDLELAVPALLERSLTARFFVLSGKLDQPGYLSREALRELSAAGMGVGSHGAQHVSWRGLSREALRAEIHDSRAILEDILQAPVAHVACPFGAYDRRVLEFLRSDEVAHVYTSDRGAARSGSWLQARNSLHRGDGAGALARIRAEAASPLRSAARRIKSLAKRYR